MNLCLCPECGQHHLQSDEACPHCHVVRKPQSTRVQTAVAVMMGLQLTGCGVVVQDLYGVPVMDTGAYVDEDGDGFPASEDCDDQDETIFPGAEEVPGDGVDQNCNGEDDD